MPSSDPSLFWALVLLLIGLGCIVLEMFIPSAGMLGLLATLSLVTSLVLAFSSSTSAGVTMTLAVTVLVPIMIGVAMKYWPHTPIGRMILLKRPEKPDDVLPDTAAYRTLHALVGKQGVAMSDMFPSGIVSIEGHSYDAIASGMPIESGESVKVVGLDTQRLVVRHDSRATPSIPKTAPAPQVPPGIEDPFA